MEVVFTDYLYYEDVFAIKPVPFIEIEELNFVTSLYGVLADFNTKVIT